jgi:hypothetical protein
MSDNKPEETPPENKIIIEDEKKETIKEEKDDFKILSLPDLIQDNCKTKSKANTHSLFSLITKSPLSFLFLLLLLELSQHCFISAESE